VGKPLHAQQQLPHHITSPSAPKVLHFASARPVGCAIMTTILRRHRRPSVPMMMRQRPAGSLPPAVSDERNQDIGFTANLGGEIPGVRTSFHATQSTWQGVQSRFIAFSSSFRTST
jgi:hypothetical protein